MCFSDLSRQSIQPLDERSLCRIAQRGADPTFLNDSVLEINLDGHAINSHGRYKSVTLVVEDFEREHLLGNNSTVWTFSEWDQSVERDVFAPAEQCLKEFALVTARIAVRGHKDQQHSSSSEYLFVNPGSLGIDELRMGQGLIDEGFGLRRFSLRALDPVVEKREARTEYDRQK